MSTVAPGPALLDPPPDLDFAGRVVRITGASKGAMETMARTPAEIAACAMFLASPIAGYVTGTTLFADGGWSAR